MLKILYVLIAIAVVAGAISAWLSYQRTSSVENLPVEGEMAMCTMDAQQCPDGSYVGRSGPQCEFVCPEAPAVPADTQASIDAHADLIVLDSPLPLGIIENGLIVSGKARGGWYFEASFPLVLKDSVGVVIAEVPASAVGDWMTSDFVPFTATLNFTNPYQVGDPETMKNGTLVLKKDNPSGLPENDDALEIPVRFAP